MAMAYFFHNLARAVRVIVNDILNNIFESFRNALGNRRESIPGRLRRLLANRNFPRNERHHLVRIVCTEENTRCQLLFNIYNVRNDKKVDVIIDQDTATSTMSEVQVIWDPRNGESYWEKTLNCPVEATVIRDMFI